MPFGNSTPRPDDVRNACPVVTTEHSPAFQRRVRPASGASPEGTLKAICFVLEHKDLERLKFGTDTRTDTESTMLSEFLQYSGISLAQASNAVSSRFIPLSTRRTPQRAPRFLGTKLSTGGV